MKVETKYNPSQPVYLVHDPEQLERRITEISVSGTAKAPQIKYLLICGSEESWHHEWELSTEKSTRFL